jgi:hypothetical protein
MFLTLSLQKNFIKLEFHNIEPKLSDLTELM